MTTPTYKGPGQPAPATSAATPAPASRSRWWIHLAILGLYPPTDPQSKVDLLPYQDKIVQGKQQRWKHDIYNLLAQS